MTIYLLMVPACIEVLLINVPVWSVREEPGYCCDGLCSLAGSPEEKKTLLLAYLVREKKMWRLWLGEGDVRSTDG